jgi:hypothetical protein
MNDTDNPPVSTRDAPDVSEESGQFSVAALFASCAWFRTLAAGHQELVLATSHAEYRVGGVSRQRINQTLQGLEKAGLVRLSYNQIEVLDLAGLSAYGREQM